MNNCRRINMQAGFTLVEALVVAVLTVLVIAAFGAFMLKLNKSLAQYGERAKQNEDSGLTVQTLTDDLEQTGRKLTVSSKEKFTGEVSLPFIPNNDYQISESEIVVNGSSAGSPLVSALLWNGKGRLRWQSNQFTASVYDSSFVRQMTADQTTVAVFENQVQKARVAQTGGGDFTITFSSIVVDGQSRCRTQYEADGRRIYESVQNCPSEPQQISFQLASGGYLYSPTLNAAEMTFRDSGSLPVRLPLLPFSGDARLTSPLVRTADGFFILSGDAAHDAMYLTEEGSWTPASGGFGHFPQNQSINLNDSQNLQPGDVLMVCDYLNNRAVLLQVVPAASGGIFETGGGIDGVLAVTPIYQPRQKDAPAGFQSLYLPPADFDGFTFSQGSRVIKLAAPVEYRVGGGDQGTSLYRRSRGESWELVLPNIGSFNFAEDVSPARVTYEVSFNIKSEGAEIAQTGQQQRISVSPRALNRTYDAR